ncbi:MAG: signal peptide peptidase SppA [Alphaproteobacteria bacterium]|jgi:protease IV|nr:signal peptide peptidase SppA [Alphaproteobacteria bacterium]MBU0803822.1 signal peptide peptidase SppA [Alphaproteobacteria bacterium]MBU0872881.1 signal peptide peptidase SppA [Alphaproteobacteria bacterium]MBU1402749.1 signal peptide peptidase SppA [Alphaproteobacteria bacterium]MBU1593391.1 signal peptide peptidase SppA [Alphaproteobacteria bacterium]
MAMRADDLIDRRRLRRKLTFWRVAALGIVAVGLAAAAAWTMRDGLGGLAADHIAKVRIEGTITEDDELLERLEKIRKEPAVKGVILAVDSPGGTTAGGEAIFDAVRLLAAEKPVVAQVGTLAASAGYMIASATDHIVARKSSIIGSIGVLVQFPDVTGLMEKVGIKLEEVKSSPLKAEPSPFNATTEPERAMLRAMILDSYDWFKGLVAERRPLSAAEVALLADGSVFTGRQALKNKLVDELGGESAAIGWLETKGVDAELKVIEWKQRDDSSLFPLPQAVATLARLLGLPEDSATILHELGAERLFLDGLVSVWHP